MATLTKIEHNKYTVGLRLNQLESLVVELQQALQSIELKEGRPGRDAVSVKGDRGERGERGIDGAPSTVAGPPGPPGDPGRSIVGPQGPPGNDSAALLAEVRKELAALRGQVAPLTAEFHKYLEAQANAVAARAEYMTAATERIKSKRS